MADTYYEEPFVCNNEAPPEVLVGCHDCGWREFVRTVDDARKEIQLHRCEGKGE